MKIENLVRKNILNLRPYSSARSEFAGTEGVFLDANENPFGTLNRYPDPLQRVLKEKLSQIKNVPTSNVFIGNGSDEVIDLVLRIFCEPGTDSVLICPPTYGMYEVSANINNLKILEVPLTENFQLNIPAIWEAIDYEIIKPKVIFLCAPNNPTGNLLEKLEDIIPFFNGIVVLDEAYIDFCSSESLLPKLAQYPNLVISQTLSKAWGLAAARVGLAFASEEIISYFNKVKPPYNVSLLNQTAALSALNNLDLYVQNLKEIQFQKNFLIENLRLIPSIKKIYPSNANFILVEVENADEVYNELKENKIIIRNRNAVIKNCLRITIGTDTENQRLLSVFQLIAK